jgi:hypothetical protein
MTQCEFDFYLKISPKYCQVIKRGRQRLAGYSLDNLHFSLLLQNLRGKKQVRGVKVIDVSH